MYFDRVGFKEKAKQDLSGQWGNAILVTFLANALLIVGALADGFAADGSMLQGCLMMINGPFALGGAVFFLMVAERKSRGLDDFFSGMSNALTALLAGVLMYWVVGLGLLLLVVPGIIFSLMFSQTMFILADHPSLGVIDAMKLSAQITRGYKGDLFIMALSFFLWMLLGAITFGLGYLYVWPYMQASYANAYRFLRADAIERHAATYADFALEEPTEADAESFVYADSAEDSASEAEALQADYEEEFWEEEQIKENKEHQ